MKKKMILLLLGLALILPSDVIALINGSSADGSYSNNPLSSCETMGKLVACNETYNIGLRLTVVYYDKGIYTQLSEPVDIWHSKTSFLTGPVYAFDQAKVFANSGNVNEASAKNKGSIWNNLNIISVADVVATYGFQNFKVSTGYPSHVQFKGTNYGSQTLLYEDMSTALVDGNSLACMIGNKKYCPNESAPSKSLFKAAFTASGVDHEGNAWSVNPGEELLYSDLQKYADKVAREAGRESYTGSGEKCKAGETDKCYGIRVLIEPITQYYINDGYFSYVCDNGKKPYQIGNKRFCLSTQNPATPVKPSMDFGESSIHSVAYNPSSKFDVVKPISSPTLNPTVSQLKAILPDKYCKAGETKVSNGMCCPSDKSNLITAGGKNYCCPTGYDLLNDNGKYYCTPTKVTSAQKSGSTYSCSSGTLVKISDSEYRCVSSNTPEATKKTTSTLANGHGGNYILTPTEAAILFKGGTMKSSGANINNDWIAHAHYLSTDFYDIGINVPYWVSDIYTTVKNWSWYKDELANNARAGSIMGLALNIYDIPGIIDEEKGKCNEVVDYAQLHLGIDLSELNGMKNSEVRDFVSKYAEGKDKLVYTYDKAEGGKIERTLGWYISACTCTGLNEYYKEYNPSSTKTLDELEKNEVINVFNSPYFLDKYQSVHENNAKAWTKDDYMNQCYSKETPVDPDYDYDCDHLISYYKNKGTDLSSKTKSEILALGNNWFADYNGETGLNWTPSLYIEKSCPHKLPVNCTPNFSYGNDGGSSTGFATCRNGFSSYKDSNDWENCIFEDNGSYTIDVHKSSSNAGLTYKDDTLSKKYCEVYCIEELESFSALNGPTVVAGKNFVWPDQSANYLKGKRTCRTKEVDYAGFKSDLDNASRDVKNKYIEWRLEQEKAKANEKAKTTNGGSCNYYCDIDESYDRDESGVSSSTNPCCTATERTYYWGDRTSGELSEKQKDSFIRNHSSSFYTDVSCSVSTPASPAVPEVKDPVTGKVITEAKPAVAAKYTCTYKMKVYYTACTERKPKTAHGIIRYPGSSKDNPNYTASVTVGSETHYATSTVNQWCSSTSSKHVSEGLSYYPTTTYENTKKIAYDNAKGVPMTHYNTMVSCYSGWSTGNSRTGDNLYNVKTGATISYVGAGGNIYSYFGDLEQKTTYTNATVGLNCKHGTIDIVVGYNDAGPITEKKEIEDCSGGLGKVTMTRSATTRFVLDSDVYRYVNKMNGLSFHASELEHYNVGNFNYIDIGHGNLPVSFRTIPGIYGRERPTGGELSLTYTGFAHTKLNGRNDTQTVISSNASQYGEDGENKYVCEYTVVRGHVVENPSVPTGGLTIIYRPIDLQNPFPSIDGDNRPTGSNWCNTNDCSHDNDVVDRVILNNRNEIGDEIYNITPMYSFKLTPTIIKYIRNYNESNNYDNETLVCDEGTGKHCISDFLTDIIQMAGTGGVCSGDYNQRHNNFDTCRQER